MVQESITKSAATPKPSWVQNDLKIEEKKTTRNKTGNVEHATIEEPCPNCSHHELFFYTMQLRSADEGSTVFYECPKCAYKFSQNN